MSIETMQQLKDDWIRWYLEVTNQEYAGRLDHLNANLNKINILE